MLQVVADAPCRQLVGETWHPGDDLVLGQHDEEDRDQREAGEGADDVEGVFGRGVVAPPGDRAGQPVRFGDVLAPAQQREAGPDRRHQPDATAHSPDVGFFHPHGCERRMTLTWAAAPRTPPRRRPLPGHAFPAMSNLTVNQAVAGLQVAEDADGGDGEHAAQAEDEAAEAVVNAGGALAHPGVVEGGEDGERVEADAAEEVHRRQVDAQQLRADQPPPAVVADDQNQPVTQHGQQNWTRREALISRLLPLKWSFQTETEISDVERRVG